MPHLPPANSNSQYLMGLMWGCDPSISQAYHQHFTLLDGTLTCPTLYKGFILWFRLDSFWKALAAVLQNELLKALLAPRHFCHKESELCVVQRACTFAVDAHINATVWGYQSAPILYRAPPAFHGVLSLRLPSRAQNRKETTEQRRTKDGQRRNNK